MRKFPAISSSKMGFLSNRNPIEETKSWKNARFRALFPHHRVRQSDSTGNCLDHMPRSFAASREARFLRGGKPMSNSLRFDTPGWAWAMTLRAKRLCKTWARSSLRIVLGFFEVVIWYTDVLEIPFSHRGLGHSGRHPNNSMPMTGVPNRST